MKPSHYRGAHLFNTHIIQLSSIMYNYLSNTALFLLVRPLRPFFLVVQSLPPPPPPIKVRTLKKILFLRLPLFIAYTDIKSELLRIYIGDYFTNVKISTSYFIYYIIIIFIFILLLFFVQSYIVEL